MAGFEIQDGILKKYDGTDAVVTIPDGVTEIGDRAFANSKTLTEVIMPDTVVKIGKETFEKCAKLKSIRFSAKLEEIGYKAFAHCKALKEVHLPDTIRKMDSGVFGGCAKLAVLECASKVYEPEGDPFSTYDVPASDLLVDKDGFRIFCGALYKYTGDEETVTVPDGVTHIMGGAFKPDGLGQAKKLKSLILPDTVTNIGHAAFDGCNNLEHVQMPAGITVGINVFHNCPKLADENGFFLHDGVALAYFGDKADVVVHEGVVELAANLFSCSYGNNPGNRNIHTVTLPRSLKKIGAYAFSKNALLERLEIPAGVTEIGDSAFAGCFHLTEINLPDGIEKLGRNIFVGCKGLADENGFVIVNHAVQNYFGTERDVVIPEGVTEICTGVFDKSGITSIKLPKSLRKLGSAFEECNVLTEIEIPDGVTELFSYTFKNCSALKRVVLPSTLKKTGYDIFRFCTALEEITLPDGLQEMNSGVFFGCTALQSIRIPDGVRVLRYDTFKNCTALERVTLPANLTELDSGVFHGCTALKEIDLPAGVTVGAYAFQGCTALKRVGLASEDVTFDLTAFDDCKALADGDGRVILGSVFWKYIGKDGHVTVPEGIKKLAPNALREGWDGFGRGRRFFRVQGTLTGVTLPASLEVIGSGALSGCTNLTELILPEGVTEIGEKAFAESDALTELVIPAGVTALKKEVFCGCESLSRLFIHKNITELGTDVFKDCTKLEEITVDEENPVFSAADGILYNKAGDTLLYCPGGKAMKEFTIPAAVHTIAPRAFGECYDLCKVVIPAAVKHIGDEAFPRRTWNRPYKLTDIEVEIGAGTGSVGESVFGIVEFEKPLVYPKIPVTFPKEQTTEVLLALGYCTAPEQYEGEYAEVYRKYAASHEKTLRKKASALKLKAVEDYFDKQEQADKAAGKPKKVNAKKLSATDKVEMLEKAILTGDAAKVKEVIALCGEFEFTARALGMACLYGSLEIVRLLVEHGASFAYEYTPVLKRKYGAGYGTAYSVYPADYALMIADMGVDPYINIMFADSNDYHFGTLPEITAPRIDDTARADIAAYLTEAQVPGWNPDYVLYYAILWGCRGVVQKLMELGAGVTAVSLCVLTETTPELWRVERGELIDTLPVLSEEACVFALEHFAACLKGVDKQMILTQKVFESEKSVFRKGNVLRALIEHTDTSKLTKSRLLELAVDADDPETLEIMVQAGWMKTAAQREKTIAYASQKQKVQALAWLMDYKNKTVDVAAEAAKEEKKMQRALSENPNSVSALKKIWSYKKQEDGTLIITSYKGEDEDVVIPAVIGKDKVTAIGEDAFSASGFNGRVKNLEARKNIRRVTIPEGVISIGSAAFFECGGLEAVDLPSTLKTIDSVAFRSCKSLKQINLPAGVRVDRGVFWQCDALYDRDNCIILNGTLYCYRGKDKIFTVPAGVTGIGSKVLSNGVTFFGGSTEDLVEEIILPEGVVEICEKAFDRVKNLKKINFPNSLRKIGAEAFRGSSLREISLPEGLESIGDMAFAGLGVSVVRIPKSVKTIGKGAFYGCGSLRDFHIGAETTELGEEILGAFDSNQSAWNKPSGIYVHTPAGSAAQEYMKQYSGVHVVND